MFVLRLSCPQCRRLQEALITAETQEIFCPSCSQGKVFPEITVEEVRWFVARENARIGPFSLAQLKMLVQTRQLLTKDMVWQVGTTRWVEAGAIAGLSFLEDHTVPILSGRSTVDEVLLSELNPAKSAEGPLSMKGIKVRPDLTLTLGDFQILKKLGAGGMGTVYLARQRSQDRLVALKMLSEQLARDAAFVQRFYREALLLASLDHPQLPRFCGSGEENDLPFFAMEYIDGFSTATLLKYLGRFPVADALFIVLSCARALAHAFSRHIVHRDIKPANIMITRQGEVKIADLGLAKSLNLDTGQTDTGITMGTPRYMAPEQHKNAKNSDHRSDIYALGGVLYRFLTGDLPFKGETAAELMLAKEQGLFARARTRNQDVPPRLDLIIDKMLAKGPRYRYQSYDDLIGDLENLSLAGPALTFDPAQFVPPQAAQASYDLVEILIINDNTRDIHLAQSAVEENEIACNINLVSHGFEAIAYLHQHGKYAHAPLPNLIILGTSMHAPGTREVLEDIRAYENLRDIPLVILTTEPGAASYLEKHGFQVSLTVEKPDDLLQFDDLIKSVQGLFLTVVERFPQDRKSP